MDHDVYAKKVAAMCAVVRKAMPELSFTLLEIGAVPLEEGIQEPFYALLDHFPGSRVIAFEVDPQVCERLNAAARPGVRYYPYALGGRDEERTFYITNHPMCCSLYEPDTALLEIYNHLDVVLLKSTEKITTTDLDGFMQREGIVDADFIKIDVQGAELDVFRGGKKALGGVVQIISEVEFIPLYKDQPLFGDVCSYLGEFDLMFHKFLDLAGRTLKPVIVNNEPYYAGQHMWSDAVFIRHPNRLEELAPEKLLKLGVLAFLYASVDLAHYCFEQYDKRLGTNIREQIEQVL